MLQKLGRKLEIYNNFKNGQNFSIVKFIDISHSETENQFSTQIVNSKFKQKTNVTNI